MQNITKVSDITMDDVADYLRIAELDTDMENTLESLLTVAKAYVVQYTGQAEADLDDYSDIVIVVLILCQDMYDNRTMYIDKGQVSNVVKSILNLHSVNLL